MRRIFFLVILLGMLSFSSLSYAFWLWSPSTGKWENPKYPPIKGNAQKQFNFAKQFYENKEYQRAKDEFNRLIKHYPDSADTYKGQFYLGRTYEALDKPYVAFGIYKKCVNNYPYAEELENITEREYRIGDFFLGQEVPKVLGLELSLPVEKALEIFKEVKRQAPYTEWGALSQYKSALCYQKLKKWKEAIAEFNRFISKYPEHLIVVSGDADYQIAISYFENVLSVDYAQQRAKEALKHFEDFIINYPQSEKVEEVKKKIVELNELTAESLFKAASFYGQQGYVESARTYYQEIIDKYGETSWAEKAKENL